MNDPDAPRPLPLPRQHDDTPEADRILAEVVSLLQDLHRGSALGLDLKTNLVAELGLDSLAMVELLDRVEHAFGVRLPEDLLSRASTPGDWLAAVLEARGQAAAPTRTVVALPPQSERRAGQSWPEDAKTLVECLAWHGDIHPDQVGIRLLRSSPEEGAEDLSYGELQAEAITCARGLVADGLLPGERVAIMLPTCREYFVVFMGALLAGGVPVPIYPPARLEVLEEHLRRQARLLKDAGASVLVTVPEALLAARLLRTHVPTLRTVRTARMLAKTASGTEHLPAVKGDDIALIQYTSGSTSDPKGVVLSHDKLLANVRAMGKAARVTSSDVFVSWLPLYHDMGLIGAWHAASLHFGMLLVIMSPLDFLARPAKWLEAISDYSGTLSAAPNFAYQSCVERVDDLEMEGLDLSSWRLAFNGSEPVSALSTERFIERFERVGFRRATMCPAYGLAEVGVGVAFSPLGRGPRIDVVSRSTLAHSARAVEVAEEDPDGVCFVGCGIPLPGYEIRVRGSRGEELPDRREGHVECRGPSATSGYFGNEEATRVLWSNGWLDTGDLGYVADGEFYLTGRAKDLVIRGGRNLHPEELEQEIGELEHVRRDGVAVFASTDDRRGTERLVVAAETELVEPEEREALRASILRKAVDLLGAAPDEVALVGPGALPRTASGKIRRSATRAEFEAGTLGHRRAPAGIQLARFAVAGVAPAAHRLLLRAGAWCYSGYVWILVAAVGVPLWAMMAWLPLSSRSRWALVRLGGRSLQVFAGIDLRVEGEFPGQGSAAVVVSNHPSFVDGLVMILSSRAPVAFVSSTDFLDQRFVGRFLRRLGCVFVHRDEPSQSARDVAELVRMAREGQHLMVFPEGSITRAPGLRRFRLGAFAVACGAACPVVPVGIRGTRDVVRPGSYLPRRARVRVIVGTPLVASGDDFAAQVELAERAREEIALLSGEPDVA